jgi:hypothetical protein
MAGILTQAHMQRLEAHRRVNLELQGEPGSISLQKLDSATGAYVDFLTIDRSFYPFFTSDADGKSLPPDVRYELQIGELMITEEDAKQVAAVQHGSQRFRVVRGDQAEPGIVPPTGPRRFWRFHIAALEEVP